jgi:hypothetical protein
MKILLGLLIGVCAISWAQEEANSLQSQQTPDLELTLSLDKDVYGQSDPVLLTIVLKNISSNPVMVLPRFVWPGADPIRLNFSDPEGLSVRWIGADISLVYPANQFSVLNPNEKITITTDLRNVEQENEPVSYRYIISKEGSYQISAEYVTSFPSEFPPLTSTSNTVGFTIGSSTTTSGEEANSLQSQQTPDLELTLSLDKDVYGQLDPVLLTIVLKNVSSSPVTVLPEFMRPNSPPIWLNISDSEGRRIRWNGPEVRLGFSALVNEFTVLNPNEEVTITTDLRNMVELDEIIRFTYLLSEEGDYQISAEYITPHLTGFPELTSTSNTAVFTVKSN